MYGNTHLTQFPELCHLFCLETFCFVKSSCTSIQKMDLLLTLNMGFPIVIVV
jgi:hypothetical protein